MNSILSFPQAVGDRWWALFFRGIIALCFGALILRWPVEALASLVLLWGAYALADGILAMVLGFQERWWGMIFVGGLGMAAGMASFVWPGATAVALVYLMGTAAIIRGILEIAAAVRLRKEIRNEWLLIAGGIGSVILGSLVLLIPGMGAFWLVWMLSTFLIFFGFAAVFLSLRVRRLQKAVP